MKAQAARRAPAAASFRNMNRRPEQPKPGASLDVRAWSFQRIGCIAAESEALRLVLDGLGLDYWCGGDATLEVACSEAGLDLSTVLNALAAAAGGGQRRSVDLRSAGPAELVAHFADRHARYFSHVLPAIERQIGRLAQQSPGEPRCIELHEAFRVLKAEIDFHILKEESVLFPLIGRIDTSSLLAGEALQALVHRLHEEHHRIHSEIHRIAGLAAALPETACCARERALLVSDLAGLAAGSRLHIHEEANILYPRLLGRHALGPRRQKRA